HQRDDNQYQGQHREEEQRLHISGFTFSFKLMCLIRTGGSVGRIYFLNKSTRRFRRRLELPRIFPCHGTAHKVHPDRQRRVRSGLFGAQGFLFVESHPNSTSQVRREPHKPCVRKIVGRARLSGNWERQLGGGRGGSVQHDL